VSARGRAPGGERPLHRVGIMAAGGGPDLVDFTDVGQLMVATSILGYRVADLDGDGVDEVIEWWRKSAHGPMGSDDWLVIRKLDGKRLARIAGPHVGIFYPPDTRCSGEWQVTPRELVVTVRDASRMAPSACLPVGTHRFVLVRGALAEVR